MIFHLQRKDGGHHSRVYLSSWKMTIKWTRAGHLKLSTGAGLFEAGLSGRTDFQFIFAI